MPRRFYASIVFVPLVAAIAVTNHRPAAADTLTDVRAHGSVRCGVGEVPGFAMRTADGVWSGFWIEMCRAIAAATLGDADKITLLAAESLTPFQAVTGREVDLLTEGTTHTLARDTQFGLDFPAVYYFDGQGFLTAKTSGISTAQDLDTAKICVVAGTTTERNLASYLRRNDLHATVIDVESHTNAWDSFVRGRCDVLTHDVVILKAMLTVQFRDPADYIILPEVISREPTGPVVRPDDRRWYEIVRWTILAMIGAEEYGITSSNIDGISVSEDAQVQALTGNGDDHAQALGLTPGWMRRVITQVGNYGEVFDRTLTRELGLQRGQNALWRDGGYIYAPPLY